MATTATKCSGDDRSARETEGYTARRRNHPTLAAGGLEQREHGNSGVNPLSPADGFRAPANAVRNAELDEIGLLIWDHCDGETPSRNRAHRRRSTSVNLQKAEVATLGFLDMLAKRGLIGVAEEQNK